MPVRSGVGAPLPYSGCAAAASGWCEFSHRVYGLQNAVFILIGTRRLRCG
jgi:hypothetical protein